LTVSEVIMSAVDVFLLVSSSGLLAVSVGGALGVHERSARDRGSAGPSPGAELPSVAMSVLIHLEAFRSVLIRSALAVLVGFLMAMAFIDPIYAFVMSPLRAAMPDSSGVIYTEPGEAFLVYIKLGIGTGVIAAMPFLLWQGWALVAPALHARQRRLAFLFVFSATSCFAAGVVFGHYVLFPATWAFFAAFSTDYLAFRPRLASAFALYVRLVVALGLAFQMPTVVMFMARIGLVTPRGLIRHVKYALLAIFVVAAVVTPGGDPVSQFVMALPLMGLYALSIGVAWIFQGPRVPS
jgi:sec-independent protein translocase protein TatC